MPDERTALFNMRITPEERVAWRNAALQSGKTMTGWLRALANESANPGSVLTEGGEDRVATTDIEEGGLASPLDVDQGYHEPPSVSTEQREITRSEAMVIKGTADVARVVPTLQPAREFHPDPKPAGRKKKR